MNSFKGTKEKWDLRGTSIYVNNRLMATCWSGDTKHLNERLKGESWLDMRNRTKEERNLLSEYIPKANALLISKAPEMLEMLEKVVALEDIICMGGAVADQWVGEAQALDEMMNKIKQLIKEATTL